MLYSGNPESWINTLNTKFASFSEKKLTDITLPGSHDAATYTLTKAKSFSVTQTKTLQEQFLLGVRYFDIRVKQKSGGLVFFHGMITSDTGIVKAELAALFGACIAHQEPIIIKMHFDKSTSYSEFSSEFIDADLQQYIIRPAEFHSFPVRWLIANQRYIAILTKNGGGGSELTMDYRQDAFGGWANTRDIDKLEEKMKRVRRNISDRNANKLKIIQTNQPALSGTGRRRFTSVLENDAEPACREVVKSFVIASANILTGSVNENKPEIEQAIQVIRGVISLDNIGGDSDKDTIVLLIISLNQQESFIM